MRILILMSTAVLMLSLSSATTNPRPKQYHLPNAAFFFANNDNFYEAMIGVAETLCIQDKVTDTSPEAWLAASAKCADSERDDEGNSSSHDGGWRNYVYVAIDAIKTMCQTNSAKLCKNFR